MLTAAIIGAGFAGIAAALKLREAGFPDVAILERADEVGGTWRDNRYPGAACDIPSHLYSLSFEPKVDWTHRYARQPEIWAYLRDVVRRRGLESVLHLGVDVRRCRFDAARALWVIEAADGRRFEARHLIAAVGPIRDPRWPDIPGIERFEGPSLHSARWDPALEWAGQRVGVIGTGASAIQIIPALAPEAAALHVFQRTPAWVAQRQDGPYSPTTLALLKHVPGLRAALRLKQYIQFEYRYPMVFSRWPVLRPLAERMGRHQVSKHVSDPALREALTPRYRMGCKRVLSSSDFYPAMARGDVSLHTAGIAEVLPEGVRLETGERVELDILVWCTGFKVDQPLGQIQVTGLEGRDLAQTWGRRPVAYLGATMPGFPNAWILLGPNTGLGHNSVLIMMEAQLRYVVQGVRATEQSDADWLEVREDKLEAFVQEMDLRHEGQAWRSGCSSWYLNADGQNFAIWPGSSLGFMLRTRRFDSQAYREGRVLSS